MLPKPSSKNSGDLVPSPVCDMPCSLPLAGASGQLSLFQNSSPLRPLSSPACLPTYPPLEDSASFLTVGPHHIHTQIVYKNICQAQPTAPDDKFSRLFLRHNVHEAPDPSWSQQVLLTDQGRSCSSSPPQTLISSPGRRDQCGQLGDATSTPNLAVCQAPRRCAGILAERTVTLGTSVFGHRTEELRTCPQCQ